jgi:poly-gamma-glutamate synthesis protein (capsule biosynthesis protein)
MIARLHIADGRLRETSILPLWIDRDAVPRLPAPDQPHFAEVVDYLRAVTAEAGLNARFRPEDARVVLEPGAVLEPGN